VLARRVVEGFCSGLHRSPHKGFSVEFKQHRQYVRGDETRHIDWKVFGKTDRIYIREYEEETNLRCTILLDKSGSMGYQGSSSPGVSKYLERSFVSPRGRNGDPDKKVSGFAYMPRQGRATESMTGAGLLAMQVCGQYESPYVLGAADWLLEHPPEWKDRFFFYGIYYYAQGMYQRGGSHADTASEHVLKMLLDKQQENGAWLADNNDEKKHGKVYATALAVLSLSVKHHFLPIYQR
jgi:hypothetical protein